MRSDTIKRAHNTGIHARCAAGALCALFCIAPPSVRAQTPFLTTTESRDWIVTAMVNGESHPVYRILSNSKAPGFRVSTAFDIDSAAFVYPVLQSSATHKLRAGPITSSLGVDGVVYDTTVTLLPGYQAGEQLGRWELPALRGNLLRFSVDLPMTCRSVSFDERRAAKVPWPKHPWPAVAASALLPQLYVESDAPIVADRVRRWTNGKPAALRPVRLAKLLAARVLESVRTTTDLGYIWGRQGVIAGMELRGAAETLRTGDGSPFDLSATLCAVYRAAGLPARVVIGYDLAASLGVQLQILDIHPNCQHNSNFNVDREIPIIRAWVEFFLLDEATGAGEWIPVDLYRQSQVSSRPPPLDRPWDFFGSNPCMANVAPLSFHFHPPTTVVNSGPPALWGWLPLPNAPVLDQQMDFAAREPMTRRKQR